MSKALDITNMRSGMLVAICRSNKKDNYGHTYWKCKCDCGNVHYVLPSAIKRKTTHSCGCDKYNHAHSVHGMTGTRLFKTWQDMKSRCLRNSNKDFLLYGGRGIEICDEWLEFSNFMEWALKNGYTDKMEIDRINVNGNYNPDNCRFSTRKEQCNNKRNNKYLTFRGKTQSLKYWCEELSMSYTTVRARLNILGWSVDRALSTPTKEV